MTKTTLTKIQKQLLERKEQLLKDLEDIKAKGDGEVKFPEYGDKPDENAQEVDDYVTNMATEEALQKILRDIENALDRIKNKTYGICRYCNEKINEKRLLARPVASACIECKTKLQG